MGFDPSANNEVIAFAVQPDGKVLIGGYFTSLSPSGGSSVPASRIARFNADGSLDSSFSAEIGDGAVEALALEPDGDILVGGHFTTAGGQTRNRIARFNSSGVLDTGFNPGAGRPNVSGRAVTVSSIVVRPDGGIVVGGIFEHVGCATACTGSAGSARTAVARLLPDGSVDTGFDAQLTMSNNELPKVRAIHALGNGTLMIGGQFSCFGPAGNGQDCPGLRRRGVARLDGATGAVDTTFVNADVQHASTPGQEQVRALAVSPTTGKVVIGGDFATVGGASHAGYARLNADGTVDSSVTAGVTGSGSVHGVVLQPDGKVILGGDFRSFASANRDGLVRLGADGTTVDAGFVADLADSNGTWNWDYAAKILLQPDGRLLVGGWFGTVSGEQRPNAARLGTGSPPAAAPTGVTAAAGEARATVSWTGLPGDITSYVVTSTPGGMTCTAVVPASTCTVTGLTGGTEYTFTVAALNEFGAGPASSPSNAVVPTGAATAQPTTGGTSTSTGRPGGVTVPAALARAGLRVSADGRVRLPLACPAGLAGGCDASGLLTMTLPRGVQAERGLREHGTGRIRTLARFSGVQIASGATRLYAVRLAPRTYSALRAAGVRRVPADLRVSTAVAADGNRATTRQRVWLRILPLARVAVTG